MRSTPLRDAVDLAHARFSAARADLLKAVSELAASDEWLSDGAFNLSSWMCARFQMSYRTAKEIVVEAEELSVRPSLRQALSEGSIFHDQCKALEVLSEPDDKDAQGWLEALPIWALRDLEIAARKKKAEQLERRDGGIYFRMRHTEDERYMRGEFRLHPEDGALVLKAVEGRVPRKTPLAEWDKACAEALVDMAKDTASSRSGPALVIAITKGDPVAEVGSGSGYVSQATAQRMSCDCRIQHVTKDSAGNVTGIGRTSRNIPAWLRRVVEERDGYCCTFPGCHRDKCLECHHVVPWEWGGPTEAENLLLTCWRHHTLLHEGGWSLRGDPGPHITWLRPDGSPFEPRVRVTLDTC